MDFGSNVAAQVIGGLIVVILVTISAALWEWRKRRSKPVPEPTTEMPPTMLKSPTPPEHGTLSDLLSGLVSAPRDPWELTHLQGHRYRLKNCLPHGAANVTVEMDTAILRLEGEQWSFIPVAASVQFLCQPAWGSDRVLRVSWDSENYADGRGRWEFDL